MKIIDISEPSRINKKPDQIIKLVTDGKSIQEGFQIQTVELRSYLQHKMFNNSPIHRLYYIDALFRRERPQKGRQRQFYQFGAEAIGSSNPEQDAEIIAMAYNIYKKFDLQDIAVHINSIGSLNIRPKYLKKLYKIAN